MARGNLRNSAKMQGGPVEILGAFDLRLTISIAGSKVDTRIVFREKLYKIDILVILTK